ncbi:MAG: WhiB family transcriptional regulator [Angustibacter sp.]
MTGTSAGELARWVERAACASRPDLPWIDDAHRVDADARAAMAGLCASCPVAAQCRAFADHTKANAGWWAGTHRDEHHRDLDRRRPTRARPRRRPVVSVDLLAVAVRWQPATGRRRAVRSTGARGKWEQAAITWPGQDGAA